MHSGSCNINIVQQKSSISGLKASSASIEACQTRIEKNLGNLVKTEVENKLCESNCDVEIAAVCVENDRRRRRAAKQLYDVTLNIVVQQESEPKIMAIKDDSRDFQNSLKSLIDTESILKATMKILESGDFSIVEVSDEVFISSEPIQEISSTINPELVYQEIEPDDEVTNDENDTSGDGTDGGTDGDVDSGTDHDTIDESDDQNLLLKLQTENEDLKIKLTFVENSFDEMKSNYDSIK